jgi:hypothetical protein
MVSHDGRVTQGLPPRAAVPMTLTTLNIGLQQGVITRTPFTTRVRRPSPCASALCELMRGSVH